MKIKEWIQRERYRYSLIKRIKKRELSCDLIERVVCFLHLSEDKLCLPYNTKIYYRNVNQYMCDISFVVDGVKIIIRNENKFININTSYTNISKTVNREFSFRGNIMYESLDPQPELNLRESVDNLQDLISNVLLHCIRKG